MVNTATQFQQLQQQQQSQRSFINNYLYNNDDNQDDTTNTITQQDDNTNNKDSTTMVSSNTRNNNTTNEFDFDLCLRTVLSELPISEKDNKIYAHHADAKSSKWNEEIRFEPMPILKEMSDKFNNNNANANNNNSRSAPNCFVWEVGANTHAYDTRELLKTYPNCIYHAFEPIPKFHKKLQENWSSEPKVTTHGYGIGGKDDTFYVSRSNLKGQSTYIGDSPDNNSNNDNKDSNNKMIAAQIISFDKVLVDVGGHYPTLFHVNCEGCEWDMIPEAYEFGLLKHIPIIQFGTHNYGKVGVGIRSYQLCEIRQLLSKTHIMVNGGMAFAWERWIRKENQNQQ